MSPSGPLIVADFQNAVAALHARHLADLEIQFLHLLHGVHLVDAVGSGAEFRPPVDQRDAFGDRLQIECPVERGIAAADDDQVMAAEFLHAPHRIEDAAALKGLDAGDRRALRLERAAAGRYHHDLRLEHLVLVGGDAKAAVLEPFEPGHHAVVGEFAA